MIRSVRLEKGEKPLTEHKNRKLDRDPSGGAKETFRVSLEGEETGGETEPPVSESNGKEKIEAQKEKEKEEITIERLQAQLEEKTKEAAQYYDQVLRLRAEFENFKKRMQKEKAEFLKFGNENLLKALLPILDNLGRAMDHGRNLPQCATLLEGVQMTHKQFLDTLERFGMKGFSARGEIFDPERHEAIAHEESEEEANRVIGEIEKGYFFHDRLLRPAKVIVSKGKSPMAPQEANAK